MSSWGTAPCTLSNRASTSASGAAWAPLRAGKSRQSYDEQGVISDLDIRHCRPRLKGVFAMKHPTWCWFAAGLLLSGCASSDVSISGTVKLDGKPLADGDIQFIPTPGTSGPDAGAVITDGKYKVV